MLDRTDTNQEIQAENKTYTFSGSFAQAFIANSIIVYTARCVVGTFNPFVAELNLNQTLKGVLASAPVLTTMLTQIPMSNFIAKNGGKKPCLIIIAATLTGMTSLTILSAATDITTIDGLDWRYATMLASGYLIGLGSGLFPLLINIFRWTPDTKKMSMVQSVYSSVVDSSSATTPIIIHALKNYGYSVPFSLYAGVITIGGLVAIKFLQPSPYDQLKKHYPKDVAKKRAIEAGQLEVMVPQNEDASIWALIKENLLYLKDRRGMTLSFGSFVILGSFFVTETIFPTLLINGYGVNISEAIYTSALANVITISGRLIGGKIITQCDHHSSGLKVYVSGCGLTIASLVPLAFFDLPRWGLYTSIGAANFGFGLSIVPFVDIHRKWAKPINETINEIDPANVFGSLGTIGTLGGLLLPLALGLMVDGLGEVGYQYYFLIVITMMLTTAISVPVVDFNITHKSTESIFDKPMTLFGRARNALKPSKYTFDNKNEIEFKEGPSI